MPPRDRPWHRFLEKYEPAHLKDRIHDVPLPFFAYPRLAAYATSFASSSTSISSTSSFPSILSKGHWTAKLEVNNIIRLKLLLLSFSVGLENPVALLDLGNLAAVQTGNMVRVTTSIGTKPDTWVVGAAISLASWLCGSFLTGQIGTYCGHRRRAWQIAVMVVHVCLFVAATALVQSYLLKDTKDISTWVPRLALSLLALGDGAMLAAARNWGLKEIPVAVATGTLTDLFQDKGLWKMKNPKRNWQVAFIFVLVSGCLVGTVMRLFVGSVASMLTSLGFKGGALGVMVMAPAEKNEQ